MLLFGPACSVVCLKLVQLVMGELVKRYVTMNLRRDNDEGVTEDDVAEIKHDISALRYELLDVFRSNGMKLPPTHPGRETSRRRTTNAVFNADILCSCPYRVTQWRNPKFLTLISTF